MNQKNFYYNIGNHFDFRTTSCLKFSDDQINFIKNNLSSKYTFEDQNSKRSTYYHNELIKVKRNNLLKVPGSKYYTIAVPSMSGYQGEQNIFMFKCSDDWFYVEFEPHKTSDTKGNTYNTPIEYYKCDQWDGLIKLLIDREILVQ